MEAHICFLFQFRARNKKWRGNLRNNLTSSLLYGSSIGHWLIKGMGRFLARWVESHGIRPVLIHMKQNVLLSITLRPHELRYWMKSDSPSGLTVAPEAPGQQPPAWFSPASYGSDVPPDGPSASCSLIQRSSAGTHASAQAPLSNPDNEHQHNLRLLSYKETLAHRIQCCCRYPELSMCASWFNLTRAVKKTTIHVKATTKNARMCSTVAAYLLSTDDVKPLLHLATLCAPALLVSDQGHVGMFWDAVVTRAAVNTPSIIIIAQIIIATTGVSFTLKTNFCCAVLNYKIKFPVTFGWTSSMVYSRSQQRIFHPVLVLLDRNYRGKTQKQLHKHEILQIYLKNEADSVKSLGTKVFFT